MKAWRKISIGAIAMTASACAHGQAPATSSFYEPRGQAAQPASWIGAQPETSAPQGASRHVPRGQAAQPGWGVDPTASDVSIAASSRPAGRAAQPGSWIEVREQGQGSTPSVAARQPTQRVQ